MKQEFYVCDVCGAQKAAANHWLILNVSESWFSFMKWSVPAAENTLFEHICGRECLNKRIEKWLNEKG